jgi:hypothetical protein
VYRSTGLKLLQSMIVSLCPIENDTTLSLFQFDLFHDWPLIRRIKKERKKKEQAKSC